LGMQTSVTTMEISMEVPQETKNGLTLWPWRTTLRHISEGLRYLHTPVYCSSAHNSQTVLLAKVPNNQWIDKETITHTLTEYYSVINKNEIMSLTGQWIENQRT
jgi:hypothetical protein